MLIRRIGGPKTQKRLVHNIKYSLFSIQMVHTTHTRTTQKTLLAP